MIRVQDLGCIDIFLLGVETLFFLHIFKLLAFNFRCSGRLNRSLISEDTDSTWDALCCRCT